jgi:amino acid transporter
MLTQVAILILFGIGIYFFWTRTDASRWLPGLTSWLFTRVFDVLVFLLAVVFVGLPLYMAALKIKRPNDASTWSWGLIAMWVIVLAACVYMVWSGRWPRNCDLGNCVDGP